MVRLGQADDWRAAALAGRWRSPRLASGARRSPIRTSGSPCARQIAFTPDGKVAKSFTTGLSTKCIPPSRCRASPAGPTRQARGFCAAGQGERRRARPDRLFHHAEDRRQGGRFRRGHGLLDGGAPRPSRDVPRHPAAQDAERAGQIFLAAGRRSRILHRLRIRRQGSRSTLDDPPAGCSVSVAKPKPLDGGDKKTLDESFFSGLAPGTNFGFKMASRAIIACP